MNLQHFLRRLNGRESATTGSPPPGCSKPKSPRRPKRARAGHPSAPAPRLVWQSAPLYLLAPGIQIAELKAGKGDDALKAAGLSFGEAKTLSRTGQDPVSQVVFGLSLPAKDKPSFGTTTDMQGNVVLLALDEVKAGTMPEEQKKAMVQGITQNNAQIAFEAMMSNLRKDAKIKLGDIITQQQ